MYHRPSHERWADRSIPPPKESVKETVFDCSDVKSVHGIANEIPTHGGYHYCSTAVEWYYLLDQMRKHKKGGHFEPQVSLDDGLHAVEIGIQSTAALINDIRD